MQKTKLKGLIKQYTIDGQLKFIDSEEYQLVSRGKKVTGVVGLFEVYNTGEQIEATINFDDNELDNHIK